MDLSSFMELPLAERQAHIDPATECWHCDRTSATAARHAKANLLNLLTLEDAVLNCTEARIHTCHLCSDPHCTNPFHLYFGTTKENMADRERVNGPQEFGTPGGRSRGGRNQPLRRCLVCGMETRGNQIFNHVRSAHLGLKHRHQWKGVDVSHLIERVA